MCTKLLSTYFYALPILYVKFGEILCSRIGDKENPKTHILLLSELTSIIPNFGGTLKTTLPICKSQSNSTEKKKKMLKQEVCLIL